MHVTLPSLLRRAPITSEEKALNDLQTRLEKMRRRAVGRCCDKEYGSSYYPPGQLACWAWAVVVLATFVITSSAGLQLVDWPPVIAILGSVVLVAVFGVVGTLWKGRAISISPMAGLTSFFVVNDNILEFMGSYPIVPLSAFFLALVTLIAPKAATVEMFLRGYTRYFLWWWCRKIAIGGNYRQVMEGINPVAYTLRECPEADRHYSSYASRYFASARDKIASAAVAEGQASLSELKLPEFDNC